MKLTSKSCSISLAAILTTAIGVWYGLDRSEPVRGPQSKSPPTIAEPRKSAALDVVESVAVDSIDMASEETERHEKTAQTRRMLFAAPLRISGQALDLKGKSKAGHITGRVAELDRESFAAIRKVAEGESVTFPSFDGTLAGVVEVVDTEDLGWHRIGGPLQDGREGWFTLCYSDAEVVGLVRLKNERVAYEIRSAASGVLQMVERPLSDVFCEGIPYFKDGGNTSFSSANPFGRNRHPAAAVVTPKLNSRPGAPAVLLLDFDGAQVRDPFWGNIDAPPSPLSAVQRRDVWRRVKEDYLPFNINVTTDPAEYKAKLPGTRMRCIITPDDTAAPGAGGVAFLLSFPYAGQFFKGNVPCWVFNPTVKSVADAISHEFGHTFGLHHDGTVVLNYYGGHGTGATSWGPIMGAPYTRTLTQWSKGQYQFADEFEDDAEIIAGPVNNFGYAPDEVGDTPATASPLTFVDGHVEQHGVIERLGDSDVYSFTVKRGGSVLVSANGIGLSVGDLDLRLDLLNSKGLMLTTNKLDKSQGAGISSGVGPGVYYLRVRATGEGQVKGTGYSIYGSRGSYTIAGTTPF